MMPMKHLMELTLKANGNGIDGLAILGLFIGGPSKAAWMFRP